MPNPFYIDKLRSKTGKSQKVRDYVLHSKDTREFLERLRQLADYLIPKFIAEGKSYVTLSIGCTGGKHRSVVIADRLGDYLKKKKYDIKVYHRDMMK